MKIVVTGTRDWEEPEAVQQTLWGALRELHEQHPNLEGLVGDARGVDSWAYAYCMGRGIPVRRFAAKWRDGGVYNPRAGHDRNQAMINELPDLCLAVWDRRSTGTKDCMDRAFCAGITIRFLLGAPA